MQRDAQGRLIWGKCPSCKNNVAAYENRNLLTWCCTECHHALWLICHKCWQPLPHNGHVLWNNIVFPKYISYEPRPEDISINDEDLEDHV